MLGRQTLEGVFQCRPADIQSHEGFGPQGSQQWIDFLGIANAEFHHHPRSNSVRDLARMGFEQGDFGAGEAVFRLITNRREQLGSRGVVQQPRRQLPRLLQETLLHHTFEIRRGGVEVDERDVAHRARRNPAAIQRLEGGKKFRYVSRPWPGGVSQQLPRNTICELMNLPLYSPMAPGGGRKPG